MLFIHGESGAREVKLLANDNSSLIVRKELKSGLLSQSLNVLDSNMFILLTFNGTVEHKF